MIDTEKTEYESIIQKLATAYEQLAAENTRLRAEKSNALTVCQGWYSDPTAPAALRLKAAGLALQFETPRLLPEKAAIDVTAEEIEPLAVVIERRRARMDQMMGQDIEVLPSGLVRVLPKPNDGGNGGDQSGE